MIYLKNNTETQAIYIPRQTVLGGGYIPSTKAYDKGYNDGLEVGKEQQKEKLSSLHVAENGQYEREDGWNVVNVDVPDLNGSYDEGYDNGYRDGYDAGQIKYNTIADIYGSPSDSTVTFKGLVALSFKYGNGKNILFTDHTGSIILKNCQEPLRVGDECLVTARLRRNAISYISALFNPSIEVLSSNNYVVMPAKAVELTNLDDLYIPNEDGYVEMKYLYADGTVVRTPSDNFMRIETDATRPGNIALRGNFSKWETKLAEGDNIRVYMFTENSSNAFWATDIIKLGAEGGSCNLGILDWTLTSPNPAQKNASDDGYDGYDIVVVRPENIIAQEKENAVNDFKNKMDEITITQNGTYSIDSQETRQYIEFDGNSYFDTNIPFGENTKIEVAIINKVYKKEQIIGCAQYSLDEQSENYGGFGIVLWGDFAYGVFGRAKTNHIPSSIEEEEQILTLDRNGIHSSFNDNTSGWIDDSGLDDSSMYGTTIGIGKINSVANGWTHRGLIGRIRYVKIWTNKDDDSTLITYTPKTNGNFDANGVELQRLGDGTTTFVEGNVNKYPYGFKRVEVNVPTEGGSCNIQDSKWVRPSMADRAENGDIYIRPDEGFNAVGYIDFDPGTIYNEGIEEGRRQFNVQDSKWVRPSMADRRENGDIYIYPDEGFDSVGYIDLDPNDIYNEGYNKGLVDATPSTIGGIKFGNSTFEECTFNLEGIEDFSYLFENCRNLRTAPSIQKAIKNARNMFRGCSSLTTAPRYNTSEATDLGGMYAGCDKLTSVGAIDCSSLPNAPIGWNREAYIFDTNQYPSLTDFGGFLNLKQNVDLSGLIALSNNSVENIFNNLYNFSGNGETPNSIQGNITMSSFITDAVEQYRAIAESKGWTITIK